MCFVGCDGGPTQAYLLLVPAPPPTLFVPDTVSLEVLGNLHFEDACGSYKIDTIYNCGFVEPIRGRALKKKHIHSQVQI